MDRHPLSLQGRFLLLIFYARSFSYVISYFHFHLHASNIYWIFKIIFERFYFSYFDFEFTIHTNCKLSYNIITKSKHSSHIVVVNGKFLKLCCISSSYHREQ